MSKPSAEEVARIIVSSLVEEGTLIFGWDKREDHGAYIAAGEKVVELFGTTELELRLRELERDHAARPILLAVIQHIRDVAGEEGIEDVASASSFFYSLYLNTPSSSLVEAEAEMAYRLLNRTG